MNQINMIIVCWADLFISIDWAKEYTITTKSIIKIQNAPL